MREHAGSKKTRMQVVLMCGGLNVVHAHALILQWDSHSLDTLHHGVRIQIVRVGGYSSSCATRRAQCSCGLVETFRLVRAPRCRRRRRGPTGANKLRAETTRPPWKAKGIEIEIPICQPDSDFGVPCHIRSRRLVLSY